MPWYASSLLFCLVDRVWMGISVYFLNSIRIDFSVNSFLGHSSCSILLPFISKSFRSNSDFIRLSLSLCVCNGFSSSWLLQWFFIRLGSCFSLFFSLLISTPIMPLSNRKQKQLLFAYLHDRFFVSYGVVSYGLLLAERSRRWKEYLLLRYLLLQTGLTCCVIDSSIISCVGTEKLAWMLVAGEEGKLCFPLAGSTIAGMDLSLRATFRLFSRRFYLVSIRLWLRNSFHVFVLFTHGSQYPVFIHSLSCLTSQSSYSFSLFILELVSWCSRLLDGNLWKWTEVMSSLVCVFSRRIRLSAKKATRFSWVSPLAHILHTTRSGKIDHHQNRLLLLSRNWKRTVFLNSKDQTQRHLFLL